MEQFQALGETVENLWREKNYDEALLPSIAAEALREANLPEKLSAWEVIEWTLKQTHLPEQRDIPGRFGDPPITLYNAPRFHIDVYFWLEGTTAVHQHSFCGAFQVLMGSSLHSWFEWETSEQINFFTEVGNLKLKTVDLLAVGDVQEIAAGKPYIHALFHLEQPSATVVVRTHKSPLHLPQFLYYKPFLAVDPFFEDPDTHKKLQSVSALIRAKYPDADRLIAEWLETADFQTTASILLNLRNHLKSSRLDQMFNPAAPRARLEKFLGVARARHGERANIFERIFEHLDSTDEIVKRRSYVTDGEHRFFLALLMNVEGKDRILPLVKERFPDADPVEKVLDWSFDLAQTRVLGENVPNALGVENFDDTDLFVLESLLKDRSFEEMETVLKSDYPDADVGRIAETLPARAEKIKRAVIFKPLFQ